MGQTGEFAASSLIVRQAARTKTVRVLRKGTKLKESEQRKRFKFIPL